MQSLFFLGIYCLFHLLKCFFLYTLFYATFGSVVRLFTLLILITIADVTNLFSAAQFVFYGYTLCQIINTMYFFAFMRDLVCDALHNIMEVASAGQFKGNAIFLWLNGNFKNRKNGINFVIFSAKQKIKECFSNLIEVWLSCLSFHLKPVLTSLP